MTLHALMSDGSGVAIDIIDGRVRVILNRYTDGESKPKTYRNTFSKKDSEDFLGSERKAQILDRLIQMSEDMGKYNLPYALSIKRYAEELKCLK